MPCKLIWIGHYAQSKDLIVGDKWRSVWERGKIRFFIRSIHRSSSESKGKYRLAKLGSVLHGRNTAIAVSDLLP
jgi:hypothetical protein